MSTPSLTEATPTPASPATTGRWRAWPLWFTASGVLGLAATIGFDKRAGDTSDPHYMVTVRDMADLDHEMLRIGGMVGYVAVLCILVLAAMWHRRVAQRFTWSLGAPLVTFGLVAAAATLTLAYGWKGALGNYLHGAAEEGTYDDQGLYVYYVMHDFTPYLGWVPVVGVLVGLAWMAFREGLVSRGLGGFCLFLAALALGATAVTGVPGLPFVSAFGLVVAGIWLAFGRSAVVREDAS